MGYTPVERGKRGRGERHLNPVEEKLFSRDDRAAEAQLIVSLKLF